MTCTHRLADGPLVCDRHDPHDPLARGGHTYTSAWAPDGRHDDNPKE